MKETCRIHAEVFSSAEVLHGPVVLADRKFAALVFDPADASTQSVTAAAQAMRDKGATALTISADGKETTALPVPGVGHPLLMPLVQIIAFYRFTETLARHLGENADAPAGLNKVTETI
ncbi:hypothetical protein [Phaeobacter sp. J2-8]|uniref:SIS domain-containing protein n=1 Tax=Phaeobacter sp. J2-8 TaxID=2931394 RepID=UPI001FD381BA|nr:hypothetical protein [Phaeobacter sp. J2-8]MCJ7873916.1 hypothetical protein [Phaeobacter sp. J2-8]